MRDNFRGKITNLPEIAIHLSMLSCIIFSFQMLRVKPRPNDRNMSTQHIAKLVRLTCCVRLAALFVWPRLNTR